MNSSDIISPAAATPSVSNELFARLKELLRVSSPGSNKHDLATVLITACIMKPARAIILTG